MGALLPTSKSRCFRIVPSSCFVSSKPVGLFIHSLLSFYCELYSLSFHLWGNGGPNWRKEFRLFQEEERLSWRPAKKKAPKTFAEAVKSAPLSGANAEPIGKPKISNSLLNRLHFPRRSVFDRLYAFKAVSSSTNRAHAAQAPRRADAVQASVICPRCLMAGHL